MLIIINLDDQVSNQAPADRISMCNLGAPTFSMQIQNIIHRSLQLFQVFLMTFYSSMTWCKTITHGLALTTTLHGI